MPVAVLAGACPGSALRLRPIQNGGSRRIQYNAARCSSFLGGASGSQGGRPRPLVMMAKKKELSPDWGEPPNGPLENATPEQEAALKRDWEEHVGKYLLDEEELPEEEYDDPEEFDEFYQPEKLVDKLRREYASQYAPEYPFSQADYPGGELHPEYDLGQKRMKLLYDQLARNEEDDRIAHDPFAEVDYDDRELPNQVLQGMGLDVPTDTIGAMVPNKEDMRAYLRAQTAGLFDFADDDSPEMKMSYYSRPGKRIKVKGKDEWIAPTLKDHARAARDVLRKQLADQGLTQMRDGFYTVPIKGAMYGGTEDPAMKNPSFQGDEDWGRAYEVYKTQSMLDGILYEPASEWSGEKAKLFANKNNTIKEGEPLYTLKGAAKVREAIRYTELVRAMREDRVKAIVFQGAPFRVTDPMQRRSAVEYKHMDGKCLVEYRDGVVKATVWNWDDPRLMALVEKHGVKFRTVQRRRVFKHRGELQKKAVALKVFEDMKADTQSKIQFWSPVIGLGFLYVVTTIQGRLKGDADEREMIRRMEMKEKRSKIMSREDEKEMEMLQSEMQDLEDAKAQWRKEGREWDVKQYVKEKQNELDMKRVGDGGLSGDEEADQRKLERTLGLDSNRIKVDKKNLKVTFEDVVGVPDAKIELMEVVDFFTKPEKFRLSGSRSPKGVLLCGPPGTGKTLLARATERETALNQLLTEMDGFDKNSQLVVIAATNRVDVLDPALVRPGRFDRTVKVDVPGLEGRNELMDYYLGKRKLGPDLDDEFVAEFSRDMRGAGADVANTVNYAMLHAISEGRTVLNRSDLNHAEDNLRLGQLLRERYTPEREYRMALRHAAKATATFCMPTQRPITIMSIIPRETTPLGMCAQSEKEDEEQLPRLTRRFIFEQMMVGMSVRHAEIIKYGTHGISTMGAEYLHDSRSFACHLVYMTAMEDSDVLGPRVFAKPHRVGYSGERIYQVPGWFTSKANMEADHLVMQYLQEADDRCKEVMERNVPLLYALADLLMEKKIVRDKEISDVVDEHINPEDRARCEREREAVKKDPLRLGWF